MHLDAAFLSIDSHLKLTQHAQQVSWINAFLMQVQIDLN